MDFDYQLRSMTRADLDQVLALEQRCHPQPWSRTTFERELANKVARIDLLLIDEVVVGYLCSWQVAGELEIQNIVTAPEWRRKGLARLLMHELLKRASAGQIERTLLEVRAGNAAAIALYKRFGFRIDTRRDNYYADGEAAILMSLDNLSGTESG
jgi:[ribosomal protein S18]-alanine N-acetyltransferase